MKRVLIALLALVMFTGCNIRWNGSDVQSNDEACSSVSELKENLGFDFMVPSELPDGFSVLSIYKHKSNVAVIAYASGDQTIYFYAERGNKDPTGKLKKLKYKTSLSVGSYDIAFVRDDTGDDAQGVAVWMSGNMSYALEYATAEQVKLMAGSLVPADTTG
ncbi:hypothetical protein SDC9_125173 [bioreactor metagenome]|uniref:DUF4367 domain-containing protein n=1 Tax=bioreactor metagenome TaxID=1076179 RepID=A0A645CN19_9ZZZZ